MKVNDILQSSRYSDNSFDQQHSRSSRSQYINNSPDSEGRTGPGRAAVQPQQDSPVGTLRTVGAAAGATVAAAVASMPEPGSPGD